MLPVSPGQPVTSSAPEALHTVSKTDPRSLDCAARDAISVLFKNSDSLHSFGILAPGFRATGITREELDPHRVRYYLLGEQREGDIVRGSAFFVIERKTYGRPETCLVDVDACSFALNKKPLIDNGQILSPEAAELANAILANAKQLTYYHKVLAKGHQVAVSDVKIINSSPNETRYEIAGVLVKGGDIANGDFTIAIDAARNDSDPEFISYSYKTKLEL